MNWKRVLFFAASLAVSIASEAQNLAQHNWYFGNSNNAIRFNRATNKPTIVNNKVIPFGTGGSAVATDPSTANLLFYTDGTKVYNANHVVMPNGSGLTGNSSSNQPVVISPKPGDSTMFYIFTNTAAYPAGGTIAIDTVDMKIFGGSTFPSPALGDVKNPKNGAIAGLTNRSEGMVVVPHANGKDYWLITQQNSSQSFSATLIDKTHTFPTTTTLGLGLPMSAANISYNKKLKKFAVSAQDPNTDAIILTFNDATGNITFDRYIFNSGKNTATNQSMYDIQWDNAGQYLYISRVGETGLNADVLQYDYLNPTNSLVSVLKTPEFRSWGLQLAPDSAIYHIYQTIAGGPFLVKKFTKTDTIASSVIETVLPFGAIDFKGTQFPAFIPKINITLKLSFTFAGNCQNNNTVFFPDVYPNADSLHWDLGDTLVTAWSPIHKYQQAQTYTVTLTAFYQGKTQTVSKQVTINPFQLKINLVSDTTACRSEFPPPRGSSTPKQFSVTAKASGGTPSAWNWSNGQTGATLKPDSAGYYYVVATDATSGCSTYAGVNVKEYGKIDQRSNIWYFGNKAGIDFNKQPPKALNTSAMNAPAGCAIVCDRNGQVIFYTDGDQVWDRTNTSIVGSPPGIGGNPNSSQSSLIVPVQGDETLYYIFTTQAINGVSGDELRYSLFDLKMNNGKGGIVQSNVLLFAKSTERITASPQWLVSHEYGNNTFRTFRITAGGLGDPVYSSIGSDHSFQFAANGQGYMKLGPKNNLAVALSTPGTSNTVELFHLNDSTGTLSYYRKIDLKHPAGQVYGIEFSPGGNKLFASITGTPASDIFEYSIDSVGRPHLKKDNVVNALVGALQVAPDNQIYFAINDSPQNTRLGLVNAVEDTTRISPINLSGFNLAAGTNSNLGLPNFRQQQGTGFGGPGFSYTGICVGDTTKFVGTSTDPIDKFQWTFGDGSSSTQSNPNHLYASAGSYTVNMRLTNRCGLDTTITQTVKINASPAKPSIPPATPICTAAVTLDANIPNTPGLTYQWSTGATTKTVSISQRQIVSVVNTDAATGCTSTAASVVVDNRPQVNLGPDQTVCQNSVVAVLDAQNPGDTYTWTITNVTAGTSAPGGTVQFQAVDTTVPGVFKYSVNINDPVTTCSVTTQVTFTVIQSPTVTMTGINPTACNLANGSISLSGITSPNLYSYFVSGPSFSSNGIDKNAATQGPFNGLGAGTYSAIITDQVSGCTVSSSFGLSNNSFTATPSTTKACDPPIININNNAGAGFFPITYTVTNSTNGQTTTGTVSTPTANISVQLPSQGMGRTVAYTIQLNAQGGCIVTPPNYSVTTSTVTPLSITPNLCSNPATLTTTGSAPFTWTGPGIISGGSTSIVSINTGGTYQVTATSGGCPVTQSVTVNYNGPFTPNFTPSEPCQTQVTLTATPTGPNYTYRWYKNGAAAPSLIGQQVTVGLADNGASFVVEIVESQSGCAKQSAAKVVPVLGPLTASLTSTIACDDGKPFTITAATNATAPKFAWSFNGATLTGAASDTVKRTPAGIYKVDITQLTCKATASIQIAKSPIPIGHLNSGYRICNDTQFPSLSTTATLDPGFFTAYKWFKNNVALGITTRTLIADSEGNYSVDLTNSYGCVSPDKTDVINDCEPIITGPNAFRPASSHVENGSFFLYTFFISSFEIIIYNRWGEAVFESKDEKFKWNGGYNNSAGQPLPGGTYTYLVRYVSKFHSEQGIQEQRGGVVLLR